MNLLIFKKVLGGFSIWEPSGFFFLNKIIIISAQKVGCLCRFLAKAKSGVTANARAARTRDSRRQTLFSDARAKNVLAATLNPFSCN